MDKLKFALFSITALVLLGLLGYWAVATIQSSDEYANRDRIKKLENENEALKEELEELKNKLSALEPAVTEQTKAEPEVEEPQSKTTYEHQELIDDLQKLIDDGVVIRLKSRGTRVGTVQEFLSIYNKTTNRIDNDYGINTQKLVILFQKDQGLSGDGEAGETTFLRMISWLKQL